MKTTLLSFIVFIVGHLSLPILQADLIDVSQQPTMGDVSAPVQVVALLEPKCPDSKRYNNNSFPKLKAEFIDTRKIRYSVITTSFLSQSMPAAAALLCVFHQGQNQPRSDLFFKYLDYIYKVQPPERQNWATVDTLVQFAGKASSEIDVAQLKHCLASGAYQEQIIRNTAYGNRLMGQLHTPTLFVNGIKVENTDDTVDYDKLKAAILKALNKK